MANRAAKTSSSRARTTAHAAPLTARTADPHALYEWSVQDVEAEIDFVDAEFLRLRGRRAARLREDFCGTANSSCEWVRRRPTNTAVGLDLHADTLDWGRRHHVARLTPAQQKRITLLERNVLNPGPAGARMDCVLAMNFSWWIFKQRAQLKRYFRSVHRSLARDGVFFLDICGGWECQRPHREVRRLRLPRRLAADAHGSGRFTYVWQQASFNPISNEATCRIHFKFPDGTNLRRAFEYDWRIWTIREAREILAEVGFARTTAYWEGDDRHGGGNGDFKPAEVGEDCASFIAWIAAER